MSLRDRQLGIARRPLRTIAIGLLLLTTALGGLLAYSPADAWQDLGGLNVTSIVAPREQGWLQRAPANPTPYGQRSCEPIFVPGHGEWVPGDYLILQMDFGDYPALQFSEYLFPLAIDRMHGQIVLSEVPALDYPNFSPIDSDGRFSRDPSSYIVGARAPEWALDIMMGQSPPGTQRCVYWRGVAWNAVRLISAFVGGVGLWMLAGAPRLVRKKVDAAGNPVCPQCGYPQLPDGDGVCSECGAGIAPSA